MENVSAKTTVFVILVLNFVAPPVYVRTLVTASNTVKSIENRKFAPVLAQSAVIKRFFNGPFFLPWRKLNLLTIKFFNLGYGLGSAGTVKDRWGPGLRGHGSAPRFLGSAKPS